MEALLSTHLSAAGRPELWDGEAELRLFTGCELLLQADKKPLQSLLPPSTVIITSCRIIFILPASTSGKSTISEGWSLGFDKVVRMEDCSGLLRRSSRVSITLTHPQQVGVKFHNGEKEYFLRIAADIIEKKSWLKFKAMLSGEQSVTSVSSNPLSPSTKFSSTNAGIGGIVRKQERDLETVDALRKSALTDLDSLRKAAEDVVKVVQKYSVYLDNHKSRESGDVESVSGEASEIEELLQNIGIVSPVTRLTAGRVYYQQLARQLADLLLTNNRLASIGGLISLTDFYVVVNRARGTELLAPEEVLKACSLISSMNLGLVFREYPSGVKVMQLSSMTDSQMNQGILNIFKTSGKAMGLNVSEVARQMKLSVLVTKELLLQAEAATLLCRDESAQGLLFYINIFV